MTPQEIASLNAELTTDPASIGYAALITARRDADLADALNLVRTGNNKVNRGFVTAQELSALYDPTEFSALTSVQLQRLNALLLGGSLNLTDTTVRQNLANIFPANGATRNAVAAYVQRQASRAEVVLGAGRTVSHTDVAVVLRGAT